MSIPVNYFTNTDVANPFPAGSIPAGGLIEILDACLINGYGIATVAQITRSGTLATATFGMPHNFKPWSSVLIEGANEAEYNGSFKVAVIDSTTIEFTVAGSPASPATGTITAKVAPLGWEKAFSDTNRAAYRSLDPASAQHYLYVDDSIGSLYAAVAGYVSMSDIDTGTGRYPASGTAVWMKFSNGGTTPNRREIVGDGRRFFFLNNWRKSSDVQLCRSIFGFGDFPAFAGAGTESFDSVLIYRNSIDTGTNWYGISAVAAEGHAGGGVPVALSISRIANSSVGYPDPINGGMNHVPILLSETGHPRLQVPAVGPYHYFNFPNNGDWAVIEDGDKAYLAILINDNWFTSYTASQPGPVWAFDLARESNGVWFGGA